MTQRRADGSWELEKDFFLLRGKQCSAQLGLGHKGVEGLPGLDAQYIAGCKTV